jgi:hypothetical protein
MPKSEKLFRLKCDLLKQQALHKYHLFRRQTNLRNLLTQCVFAFRTVLSIHNEYFPKQP